MTSRAKAGKKENPAHGEEFEVLDVRDLGKEADSLIRSLQKYLKEKSNSKQLAVGGVSGWITGYVAMKIGKTVATALGGSLILLQIANHKGYININWSKVNKDLEGATKKIAQGASEPSIPQMLDKAADYLDEQAEKAGRVFRKKKVATRRWYHKILHGTSESDGFEAFYVGFLGGSVAGVLIGIVF